MNTFNLPQKEDYPAYYSIYVDKVSGESFSELILKQIDELNQLLESKPKEWVDFVYEEGKWSPKEVLGHITDTDRIMTFRALCFARGEEAALPGFDQNVYVIKGKFGTVSIELLVADFIAQRKALLTLIQTLSEDILDNVGNGNGKPITPRALFWIIAGHFAHHMEILKTRY